VSLNQGFSKLGSRAEFESRGFFVGRVARILTFKFITNLVMETLQRNYSVYFCTGKCASIYAINKI
jgi:hypothetical protein